MWLSLKSRCLRNTAGLSAQLAPGRVPVSCTRKGLKVVLMWTVPSPNPGTKYAHTWFPARSMDSTWEKAFRYSHESCRVPAQSTCQPEWGAATHSWHCSACSGTLQPSTSEGYGRKQPRLTSHSCPVTGVKAALVCPVARLGSGPQTAPETPGKAKQIASGVTCSTQGSGWGRLAFSTNLLHTKP